MAAHSDLRAARAAAAEGRWRDSYSAFQRAATRTALRGADLWSYALSALLIGREDEFLGLLEQAHDAHLAADEPADAARCAIWLGLRLAASGEVGRATGWLSRAARLVERAGDCVEQGYLLLSPAQQQLAHGDADAAFHTAREAVALAERFRDADLLALALYLQGRALIAQGHVGEGVALLDEAMIDVAARRLSPQVTGLVYCSVIGACRNVYELRRAQEWTLALRDWCLEQPDMLAFTGECIAYRAEIENLHGNWHGAIEEARLVCDCDAGHDQAAVAAAYYQVGDARRLLGELDAAETAYRAAAGHGREPQPGLALLRLAQGQPAAGAAGLQRALAERRDPLQRARLLPALCEILLAQGDSEASQRACAELEEIALRIPTDALTTIAACVRGAMLLAAGDAGEALARLRAALRGWQMLDAPYEAARVRLLLADACRALGDEEGAALEIEEARAAFVALGATIDVARIDARSARGEKPLPDRLTPREAEVLAVIATGRSNRAAAAHLGISEKTVARHLSNIYGKLGISSRAAATAYAYEHDLHLPSA